MRTSLSGTAPSTMRTRDELATQSGTHPAAVGGKDDSALITDPPPCVAPRSVQRSHPAQAVDVNAIRDIGAASAFVIDQFPVSRPSAFALVTAHSERIHGCLPDPAAAVHATHFEQPRTTASGSASLVRPATGLPALIVAARQ